MKITKCTEYLQLTESKEVDPTSHGQPMSRVALDLESRSFGEHNSYIEPDVENYQQFCAARATEVDISDFKAVDLPIYKWILTETS